MRSKTRLESAAKSVVASLLVGGLAAIGARSAKAATFYWDYDATNNLNAGNGDWSASTTSDSARWQSGTTPGTAAPAQWNNLTTSSASFQTGGANVVTVNGTVNVAGIAQTVSGTATTINGGTLQYWGGNVSNDQTAADLVINSDISLQGGMNVAAIASATSIYFNGVISGSGGISTSGSGGGSKAVFTNANTYTGVTTITRGIFEYRSLANGSVASGMGMSSNAASNLVLNSGTNPGIFRLNSLGTVATSTDRLFTLNGTNNTATIENNSASALATLEFSNTGTIALAAGTAGQGRLLTLGGSNGGINIFRPKITDGVITGTVSATGLVKGGSTTWRITNDNNDFTGAVNLNAGVLEFATVADAGNASALGAGNTLAASTTDATYRFIGTTAQSTNRTLANNSTTTNAVISFDASGATPDTTLSFTSTADVSFGSNAKQITLTGTNTGNNTFRPNVTNARATNITKNGIGKWILSGANTGAGLTNGNNSVAVNGGTLVGIQTTGSPFGLGGVFIGAGTLAFAPGAGGGDVSVVSGSTAQATKFTFDASAVLSLDKGTNSSLTYTANKNGTGTGFNRQNNGTLIISVGAIGDLGNTVANGGERFLFNVVSGTAVPLTNNLVSATVAQDRGNSNYGDFTTYNATDGFKAVPADLTNTFTGSTNAKYVNVTNSGISTGAAVASYALKVTGQTLTNTSTLTMGASGTGVGSIILNDATISGGTVTTPTSVGTELLVYTAGTSAISSSINTATSQAGMSVFGPGTLNLGGSSGNSFTGGLRVNNSTVIATSDGQLGGSNSAIVLTGGTLQTSGTFALGGGSRAITLAAGQDKSGGTINVASGTTTLQNASTNSKIVSGSGSLTKAGTGVLNLTGDTANTYTGGTVVLAGTLLANTSAGSSTGTGAVTVKSTGTLGGAGNISGSVTVQTGAVIAPGSSVGTLSTGTLTMSGTYRSEVDTAANTADKLVVTGNVDVTNGTLDLTVLPTNAFISPYNQTFVLIENDDVDAITGTLTGDGLGVRTGDTQTITDLPLGATLYYSYNSATNALTGGNDLAVVFTAVPEPGSFGVLGVGAASMLIGRRRRRGW